MERLGLKKVEDFRTPLRLSDQISEKSPRNSAYGGSYGYTIQNAMLAIWSGYTVSEMVTSKDGFWSTDKSRLRRLAVPGVYPGRFKLLVVIQGR